MSKPEWALACVCFGLAAICRPVMAAEPGPMHLTQVSQGSQYLVTSKTTGRIYRLFIQVPNEPPPAAGFPVFYLLDGDLQYPVAAGTERLRAITKEIPHSIVVGIGYPPLPTPDVIRMRWEDLSLPATPDQFPPMVRALNPHGGGLDEFLRFFNDQARPFVESHAPVDKTCQAFFGHSLGGLAVLRALFTQPVSFQAYIAASPAIWWSSKAVLKDEAEFSKRAARGEIRTRLLLTVGSLEEDTKPWASNPEIVARLQRNRQVQNVTELGARLAGVNNPSFQVETHVFPDETHTSVIPTAISRALKFGLDCSRK